MIDNKIKEFVEQVGKKITPSEEKVKRTVSLIRDEVEEKIVKDKLKTLVVGISGGLDSAVTAAIVAPVCRKNGVRLIGISIPLSSSEEHIERAQWVGNTYCDVFQEFDVWETSGTLQSINEVMMSLDIVNEAGFFPTDEDYRVAQGNIKARIRMMTLYNIAGVTGGAVLSTDNYSEGWLGFWTLHGDVGDISPIQYIEKGWEEPAIASYLGIRQDIIEQKPSDGLCVTDEDSDEAQLGLTYKEIGPIMFAYEGMIGGVYREMFEEIKNDSRIQNIIDRHERTHFKREGPFEVTRKMNGLFTYIE